jgi:hypothetical protein
VISHEVEERLWNEGILGDSSPVQLLDALVFSLGLQLALHSGQEHRCLRPDMFQIMEPVASKAYLLYTEAGSKNNQGGIIVKCKIRL